MPRSVLREFLRSATPNAELARLVLSLPAGRAPATPFYRLLGWVSMRVAVAGLGFMGSTHVRALQSIPDAELVAVCSSDEKKLAGDLSAVQGNLGGPGERLDFSGVAKYRDLRQMLEDPRVDAVDLCLPTHLHAPVA